MSSVSTVPFTVLEEEYLQRKSRLQELLEKQASAQDELDRVNQEIEDLREPQESEPTNGKRHNSSKKLPGGSVNKRSARDWSHSIISQFQKPMHVTELAEVLLKRGFKTVSEISVFCGSLSSILSKDTRFVRVSPNTFDVIGHAE